MRRVVSSSVQQALEFTAGFFLGARGYSDQGHRICHSERPQGARSLGFLGTEGDSSSLTRPGMTSFGSAGSRCACPDTRLAVACAAPGSGV
jgi:hypothetical protein